MGILCILLCFILGSHKQVDLLLIVNFMPWSQEFSPLSFDMALYKDLVFVDVLFPLLNYA